MCDTCGCSEPNGGFTISKPGEGKNELVFNYEGHSHGHGHGHGHGDHHSHKTIAIETDVLSKNNLTAARNRGYFEAKGIKCFNLVSSPGSGKTTILENLIQKLEENTKVYVIEGDQQTSNDADRIEKTGAICVQINTGNGCHLDAEMVNQSIKQLNPENNAFLFIENVGNLVCPALFDLGESARIVISSITEGEDKPLKYPNMYVTSHLCVINKMDLLPYLDFNLELHKEYALKVNHDLDLVELSAKTGQGMDQLIAWIKK